MSGHSKWAGIKHKKAAVDARRGQAFTRASREITIAAKEGGGDAEGNFRLRLAVQKAREVNMPADKIQAAIDRGTGAAKGMALEEVRYEGYGPAGVAILVDAVTDNRNRTAPAIRHAFSKHGGSLAESNAVGWMFERKGVISALAGKQDPEEVGLAAIEAGAEDIQVEDGTIQITTLDDVLYVGRPVIGTPESDSTLFKVEADGQHVVRAKVQYGLSSVNTIEVRSGLQPGDRVILSDMSAFAGQERLRLQ